jgi:hypothetical protein
MVDIEKIDWKGVDRIDLHQDRQGWPDLTDLVMNFQFP